MSWWLQKWRAAADRAPYGIRLQNEVGEPTEFESRHTFTAVHRLILTTLVDRLPSIAAH